MPGTVVQALARAAGQLGYVETPVNITRYWAELKPSYQGGAWCAAYVQWVLKPLGLDLLDEVSLPYYCPSIERWAKDNGRWTDRAQPGYLVLFGYTSAQHIGIVEKVGEGYIQTLEGNTSPGDTGSQNNGGGVYRRYRRGSWVRGYVRIDYAPPTPPPTAPKLADDGDFGPATRRALQAHLVKAYRSGIKVDGDFGPASRAALERALNYEAGKQGWAAAKVTGTTKPGTTNTHTHRLRWLVGATPVKGGWTTPTTVLLQRYLNRKNGA